MTEEDAPQCFAASLHDSGFALLAAHGIAASMIGNLITEWTALFDAGVPEKHHSGVGGPRGYHQPDDGLMPDQVTRRDRKDYSHLGLKDLLPKGVSMAALDLFRAATTVAGQLLGRLSATWRDGPRIARPAGLASWVRALPHADIHLLTLLSAPDVSGLQLSVEKGKWLDLDCDPHLLIVNTGEMLQVASQGYYPATLHRVVVREPADSLSPRWSLPMFFHPGSKVMLTSAVSAGAYRTSRVKECQRKGWLISTGGDRRPDQP